MTDKNISTEYTGVYTAKFPPTQREIELEARVNELEKDIEKLKEKNEALKERIRHPYISIDKADYGEMQRIYLRIKTWYKYGYSINDIEKFIEYDSYLLEKHPDIEEKFIQRLITEAGEEYLKCGLDYWKEKGVQQ